MTSRPYLILLTLRTDREASQHLHPTMLGAWVEEQEPWGTPSRCGWVSLGLWWHSLAVGVHGDLLSRISSRSTGFMKVKQGLLVCFHEWRIHFLIWSQIFTTVCQMAALMNLLLNPQSFLPSVSCFSAVLTDQEWRLSAAKETIMSAAKSALTPAKTVQGGAVTTAVRRIRGTPP